MKITIESENGVLSVDAYGNSLEEVMSMLIKAYMCTSEIYKSEHEDGCSCEALSFHKEVVSAIENIAKEAIGVDEKLKELFKNADQSK